VSQGNKMVVVARWVSAATHTRVVPPLSAGASGHRTAAARTQASDAPGAVVPC
jgi:hypothetical protein